MAGSESNPASLLRLYIDYGRYTEATNLLLEYIESFASLVSSHPYSKAFECQWLLLGVFILSSGKFVYCFSQAICLGSI